MKPSAVERLLEINHLFYQTFAVQFSDTRLRLQPGVQAILEKHIPPGSAMLDLGCGNGTLAQQLAQRGFRGVYVGLDFSAGLLAQARARFSLLPEEGGDPRAEEFRPVFLQKDLAAPGWEADLPHSPYGRVLAFASLHHIPGEERRLAFLEAVRACLDPGGQFIFSVWQFLKSPRLSERIQPWEVVGLEAADLDPGDFLMDWRRGGYGLRYVHHFSEAELASLAERGGFQVVQSFYSDGKEGDLGLYQVWEVPPSQPPNPFFSPGLDRKSGQQW